MVSTTSTLQTPSKLNPHSPAVVCNLPEVMTNIMRNVGNLRRRNSRKSASKKKMSNTRLSTKLVSSREIRESRNLVLMECSTLKRRRRGRRGIRIRLCHKIMDKLFTLVSASGCQMDSYLAKVQLQLQHKVNLANKPLEVPAKLIPI